MLARETKCFVGYLFFQCYSKASVSSPASIWRTSVPPRQQDLKCEVFTFIWTMWNIFFLLLFVSRSISSLLSAAFTRRWVQFQHRAAYTAGLSVSEIFFSDLPSFPRVYKAQLSFALRNYTTLWTSELSVDAARRQDKLWLRPFWVIFSCLASWVTAWCWAHSISCCIVWVLSLQKLSLSLCWPSQAFKAQHTAQWNRSCRKSENSLSPMVLSTCNLLTHRAAKFGQQKWKTLC